MIVHLGYKSPHYYKLDWHGGCNPLLQLIVRNSGKKLVLRWATQTAMSCDAGPEAL